jgi:hypothetical protein
MRSLKNVKLSLKALVIRSLWVCLIGSSVVGSYWATTAWWPTRYRLHSSDIKGSENPGPPVNPFASSHGTNLVVYIFTASDCGWSKLVIQKEAFRTIGAKVRSIHGASYARVTVIGVSLDEDVNLGVEHLKRFGNGKIANAFDQIVIGGSWLNEQIVQMVWREKVIQAALPQILIIERPVDTGSYLTDHSIRVEDSRIVASLTGERQISRWIEGGYQLKKVEVAAALPSK